MQRKYIEVVGLSTTSQTKNNNSSAFILDFIFYILDSVILILNNITTDT